MTTYQERLARGAPGIPVLFGGLAAVVVGVALIVVAAPVTANRSELRS